jgi:stage II sporulation protein D (peptidoglycan lytic transglycosylase)
VKRKAFLAIAAAPLALPAAARAQSDADPAMWSRRPALRVLLGSGDVEGGAQNLFNFEGRAYRGTYQRLPDGQVVNVVDLEQYLYSVVSREMSARWPPAALEVQSICARTYVLQRSDPRRSYDLIPSELDQLYEGVAGETPAGTAAVNASAGRVLNFANRFARIAYSSCCGGHTEASSDAWGGEPLPYLQGVVCTTCTDSPNYRWSTAIALDDLAIRFSPGVEPLGDITDVRITERDPSGRARGFELLAQRGSTVVAGTAFRRGVGTRVLPSLLVTKLQRAPDAPSLLLEGGGLGHGVGLCQWGARGMALAGSAASEILGYYFPGATIDNLDR